MYEQWFYNIFNPFRLSRMKKILMIITILVILSVLSLVFILAPTFEGDVELHSLVLIEDSGYSLRASLRVDHHGGGYFFLFNQFGQRLTDCEQTIHVQQGKTTELFFPLSHNGSTVFSGGTYSIRAYESNICTLTENIPTPFYNLPIELDNAISYKNFSESNESGENTGDYWSTMDIKNIQSPDQVKQGVEYDIHFNIQGILFIKLEYKVDITNQTQHDGVVNTSYWEDIGIIPFSGDFYHPYTVTLTAPNNPPFESEKWYITVYYKAGDGRWEQLDVQSFTLRYV